MRKHTTIEERQDVIKMYLETSLTIEEIGKKFELSYTGTYRILKAGGVSIKNAPIKKPNKRCDQKAVIEKYKNNTPIVEIMNSENICWSTVFNILKRNDIPFKGKISKKFFKESPHIKTCAICGITKPLSEFTPSERYVGGVLHKCKKCSCQSTLKSKQNNIKRYLLRALKTRAAKKGLDFNLTESDIDIPETCPILGMKIQFNVGANKPNSVSVDRIDNSLGYVKGNILITSRRANCLKNDASIDELGKIYNFHKNLEKVKQLNENYNMQITELF